MKIAILKYDHRHGCDLSAYETYEMANKARAEICVQFVDDRIYVNDDVANAGGPTLSQRVKALFEVGNYDECVQSYLNYNQDESLDIEEVELHQAPLLSRRA